MLVWMQTWGKIQFSQSSFRLRPPEGFKWDIYSTELLQFSTQTIFTHLTAEERWKKYRRQARCDLLTWCLSHSIKCCKTDQDFSHFEPNIIWNKGFHWSELYFCRCHRGPSDYFPPAQKFLVWRLYNVSLFITSFIHHFMNEVMNEWVNTLT